MKTISLKFLASAVILLGAICSLNADQEQDLIATLKSAASPSEKCDACVKLRIIGSAKSVPALATLLSDEKTSQAARYALEGMPFGEAVAAMREALGHTSTPIQAGLIDSLGWRRDTLSVQLLAPLAAGPEPVIGSAAATALGRIGGKNALAALEAAQPKAPAAVQPAIINALLECAEGLARSGDSKGASSLYRSLLTAKGPEQVRAGAWRGVVMSDSSKRASLVVEALRGGDRPLQVAALQVLRELKDAALVKACLNQWPALPPLAQVAVLEAHLKFGGDALPTVEKAMRSPDVQVRIAACQAAGELSDPKAVPALAATAAHGQDAEREAARQALNRISGLGVRSAILDCLGKAQPAEKAELLLALGERGDKESTSILLDHARSQSEPLRMAALESLRRLAMAETALPLLELAAASASDAQAEALLKTLYGVLQAAPDKGRLSPGLLDKIRQLKPEQRLRVLPVLAELGTPAALEAAEATTREQSPDFARQGVRVLGQWPTAAPAPRLLEIARGSSDETTQILALRSCIAVAAQEPDPAKRLGVLRDALSTAKRPDEKKQALGQMGQIASPEALAAVTAVLNDPALGDEAAQATLAIAEKLATTHPDLARQAAGQVMEHCKTPELVKRAAALRVRPAANAPFIDEWQVAGPFTAPGASNALAVFDVPFAPEKGEKVRWRNVRRGGRVNLGALFPGKENCAAYLKTQLVADQAQDGLLLLGSDDGVKAWLNGTVVHANNVDRGDVADQDVVPIKLLKGTNQLMLKITQGGGGWSTQARILAADGQAIPGVRVQPLKRARNEATEPAATAAPAPVPTACALPPRDNFQRVQLSKSFYAEGAYYGDFNRDGKLDIVAGPFWFEGPAFEQRHEYRPSKEFDPKEYSDNFLTYVGDFNADGWPDILCVPFPGKEGYWYQNPAGGEGHWKQHLAYTFVGNESPVWGDVNGDGKAELVFCNEGYIGYAGANAAKPDEPWTFHAVSPRTPRFQKFTHGIGLGDINGDGRADIVEAKGWWEQPAQATGQPWAFHPFPFAEAGAQMLVYDVDGDGLADVITPWHCHHYGLVWWQQVKRSGGDPDWKQHVILSPTPDVTSPDFRVSQMHALDLADMNGDGLKDIVTGKRFWAHGPTGDKEPDAPAVLFWLELRRSSPGNATFVPHLIDDNSGVGTQVTAVDLNSDGRTDVVVANKKGIFVHLNHRQVQ